MSIQSPTVFKIPKYFRNLSRLGEIATVLIKHGFESIVIRLDLPAFMPDYSPGFSSLKTRLSRFLNLRRKALTLERSLEARLAAVCEDLGPTFIKFGQLVANRGDLFPPALIAEFKKLQDNVSPFSFVEARSIVEQELGVPLEHHFASVSETPIGAASIAQVHRATLKDGSEVVLKIQRPRLERVINTDLDILLGLASLVEERIPEAIHYNPFALVNEFARTLRLECNFRKEARNLERFREMIEEEPGVIVPKIHHHLSTGRLLVQEFIEGQRLDIAVTTANKELVKRGVNHLNRVVLKSIFEIGYFHGDPHLGNILFTPKNEVALLDFGAMGFLDRGRRGEVLAFLRALFEERADHLLRIFQESLDSPVVIDEAILKNRLLEILSYHKYGHLDLANLIGDILNAAREHGIRSPTDLLVIGRVLSSVQSIANTLGDDFKLEELIVLYVERRYREEFYSREANFEAAAEVAHSYQLLLQTLPVNLRTLTLLLAKKQFSLKLSDEDRSNIYIHQNRLLNRGIFTLSGLLFISLACLTHIGSHLQLPLGIFGGFLLLTVWLSVRRSGGI
jgi:ubiquinone biosynthesis protein